MQRLYECPQCAWLDRGRGGAAFYVLEASDLGDGMTSAR